MPTYEYQCADCEIVFERIQKITEEPVRDCPECGGHNVKRLISQTAFQLKGSGWYKTDYASNGTKSKVSSLESNPSGDKVEKSADSSGKEEKKEAKSEVATSSEKPKTESKASTTDTKSEKKSTTTN